MKRIYIALFFASYLFCAYAKDSESNWEKCLNTSISTAERMRCTNEEYKVLDKQLNDVYSKYLKTLTEKEKKDFIDIQRLWIKFKEKNCSYYYGLQGTLYRELGAICFAKTTEERLEEIKNFCSEGCK